MAVKIMVDCGHFSGYNKYSLIGGTTSEGNVVWNIGQYLIPMLRNYGFEVGTTKSSINAYPGAPGDDNITARGRMAKGYDLFISLHTNACGTESVNRPVVIYPVSGKCKDLAGKIGAKLQSVGGWQNYQVYSKYNSAGTADYYGVIRGAAQVGVPGLIIEHTFHTNKAAASFLSNGNNQYKLAQALAEVIAAYYGYKSSDAARYTVGWHKDDKGWWYADTTTTYYKSRWAEIDGSWYYFKEDGYIMANEWKMDSTGTYYLGANGAMVTNQLVGVGADGKLKPVEKFYHLISELSPFYREEINKLIVSGKLKGKSGEGDNLGLDLPESAVRVLIILNRE